MLPLLKRAMRSQKGKESTSRENADDLGVGIYKFQHSSALLAPHLHRIESIYQTLSISREHYKKLYIPLIENIAFLVQNIPASENHHHAHLGGLLEHSLEVGVFAARLRQGVMIKGVAEDQMAIVSEALSYAVITSALLHDVGKVVTDVQIANTTTNTPFLPLIDNGKIGQCFTFRFRKGRAYTDHQKANLQLSMKLMPENGMRWLSQYHEINQHWARTLAGEYSEAGDIGRIVARADSTSTQRATITAEASGDMASHNPLSKLTPADAFVRILRSMLETQQGSIPLNKRGAAAWVAQDAIYFVSKRVLDEVKSAAERVGPAVRLPPDNSSLMTSLGDAGKLKLNEGKAIHYVTVKDNTSNWETTMSFLVFPRGQLDPANKLPETECILIDKNTGEILHGKREPLQPTPAHQGTSPSEATVDIPSSVEELSCSEQPPEKQDEDENNINTGGGAAVGNPFFENYTGPEMSAPPGLAQPFTRPAEVTQELVPAVTQPSEGQSPRTPPSSARPRQGMASYDTTPRAKKEMGEHFTQWLKNYLTLNLDKVNSHGSSLHIAEPGLLVMITPAIFGQYLNDNLKLYKEASSGCDEGSTRRSLIKKIQFSVETQLSYKAAFDGSKIVKLKVMGNRHSGTVSAYVLDEKSTRAAFQSLAIPSTNPHLAIVTPLA